MAVSLCTLLCLFPSRSVLRHWYWPFKFILYLFMSRLSCNWHCDVEMYVHHSNALVRPFDFWSPSNIRPWWNKYLVLSCDVVWTNKETVELGLASKKFKKKQKIRLCVWVLTSNVRWTTFADFFFFVNGTEEVTDILSAVETNQRLSVCPSELTRTSCSWSIKPWTPWLNSQTKAKEGTVCSGELF